MDDLNTVAPSPEVENTTDQYPALSMTKPVAWLVNQGLITQQDAVQTSAAAESIGKDPLLYFKGKVSQADLHEASLRGGSPMDVTRLSDLPEWTLVLNDAGGLMGASTRNPRVAIIANDKEGGRDTLRCFIVHNQAATKTELGAAVTGIVSARFHLAGSILVPDEVLAVLYGEWEGRGRKGFIKAGSEASLHDEFDRISEEAIRMGASDIHIGSTGNSGSIQFRVDGVLEHNRELTAEHALELCSSVYNTLSESSSVKESFIPSKPLDSAVERPLKQGLYRFRFSNLPMAPAGFDVTLRIIPIGVTTKRKTAGELGYSADQEHALERMFSRSSGLVLFAGTTGSGKSTSLANLVRKVAEEQPGKKIRTIEEPVEILMPGVAQHPVTRIHGDQRDFMIMLRQLLRADPDIVMVGEVRDGDTAQLAIQAVRTGHLCVSTIHADGAPICYDRLVGMGVSRMDMASVNLVAGLVFQKLVAVLCPHCKVPADSLDPGRMEGPELDRFERLYQVTDGDLEGIYVRGSQGCEHCRYRGINGRTVCAEILRPTPQMLGAIANGDSRELWRMWRETINDDDPTDMTGRTAFEHAIYKMKQGLLSPEDIEREFHYLDERPFEDMAR